MINKTLSLCRRLWWTSSRHSCTMSGQDPSVILRQARDLVPKLTAELHKGQCGRVGVIGGSLEYTGAPYFAAISALKLGVDLVYVICSPEAAPVIKSYSPELIVCPYIGADWGCVHDVLQRLHALVIGPGLSRSQAARDLVRMIFTRSELTVPVIVDADGLFFVTEDPALLASYPGPVVLTPNAAEYSRLCRRLNVDESEGEELVAKELNVVLVRKGERDVICNGIVPGCPTEVCTVTGSLRRCGGQGDVLSGSIAAFAAWFGLRTYKNKEYSSVEREEKKGLSLACFAGCALTRCCSNKAFARHGRSMTASDLIPFVHDAFVDLFEE